jgi:adenylate cyclase
MSNQIRRDLLSGWDVVVIDDEPDSLEVASRILRHYGANVHTAVNGKEGLALIRRVRPKFVVSDLSMPVMDGWEMLYEIQQDRFVAQIPVIALTAPVQSRLDFTIT